MTKHDAKTRANELSISVTTLHHRIVAPLFGQSSGQKTRVTG